MAYTHRTRCDFGGRGNEGNRHVKSIVNPASVVDLPHDPHFLGVRTVNENHQPVTGPFSTFSGERIRVNHYWTRSRADWEDKERYAVAPRTTADFYGLDALCVVNDPNPAELHGYIELGTP